MNDVIRLDCRPQIAESAWVAKTALVCGDVQIGPRSSVWFGAVIRGDTESIRIGCDSNLQDLSLLHADPEFPCSIGDRVTVGHAAIVHGATVGDDVLIGMRATVLNGAQIGAGSVIGAGSLIREGQQIPPGSLVVGLPARRIRAVSLADQDRLRRAWQHYVHLASDYRSRGF